MGEVKRNSIKAWVLAARPKTLSASMVPVLVASAYAANQNAFQLKPAILCLLFALFAQIASNFSNDYFDFKKKTDSEKRLGPARAVSSGWIAPKNMVVGLVVSIFLACMAGIGLLPYGGLALIWVGVACIVALLAYTAGPWPLAYHGLGDVFVLVFFGLVAVSFTFYVQAFYFDNYATIAGFIVGFQQVNILVINNYRDRENDKACKKNTSIVLFGAAFGRNFYLINGLFSALLCLNFWNISIWAALLPFLFLIPHYKTWRKLCQIDSGTALNPLLGETSRNLLLLGTLFSIGLLLRILY